MEEVIKARIKEDLRQDWDDIKDSILNEDFKTLTRVHDWRNHAVFSDNWKSLTERERMIIFYISSFDAESEVWD